MNPFMISCNKATFLIEKSHVDGLRCTEKLSLRLHMFMCEACTQYSIQSKSIEKALDRHLRTIEKQAVNPAVTDNAIQKILTKIQ